MCGRACDFGIGVHVAVEYLAEHEHHGAQRRGVASHEVERVDERAEVGGEAVGENRVAVASFHNLAALRREWKRVECGVAGVVNTEFGEHLVGDGVVD